MGRENAEKIIFLLESCQRECNSSQFRQIRTLFRNIFRLGTDSAEIIHISEPIKSHWAREKGLDLKELLSDGPYKEQYRKEMIIWSDGVRQKDPGFFCNISILKSK